MTEIKWKSMDSAPLTGETIIGKYGDEDEALICWSENPVCMLGSRNGSLSEGWATPFGSGTDPNLPMDEPDAWREGDRIAP